MSPYNTSETSQHSGSPVWGYEFVGTNETWRLTSAELEIPNLNSQVYTPIEISHKAIKIGTQEDSAVALEVSMPVDHAIPQAYAFDTVSPQELNLTVYRYHEGTNPATDFVRMWVGKCTVWSVNGDLATIRVPSIFQRILNAEYPNVYFQQPCNNDLYDIRCKIDPNLHDATSTVATVTDETTFEVVADGFADNELRGGELINTTTGERKTIVDNVANTITVVSAFNSLVAGDPVKMQRGCDHAFGGDCVAVFNNGVNFTGIPYLPPNNPWDGTI